MRQFPLIASSRFWGKILAVDNDYWIVECTMSEFPEADDAKENPERMESAGNGANKYTYFVATDIEKSEKKWIQLPNVTPDQIKKCRQIYRLFTGHLQSAVHGRVHFEWNEAVLLRAQISRIASAAIIAPNDFYVKSEEDAEDDDDENPSALEVNEEFQFLENSMSHQSWVHARPHLRLEGRCVKFVEPEVDDEAEEEEGRYICEHACSLLACTL